MKILFIKHIDIEGPGTMGEFLDKKGFEYEIINIFDNIALPDDPRQYGAIIILGGPMNVYEENEYPYLKDEDIFIKSALQKGVPMLGLCLGAQLISKATGAKVRKAAEKEIGWFKADLTDDGKNDPLFNGLKSSIDVFQWHGDTFDIPDKGVHLASSEVCKNQAFMCNNNVYGLQFHLEVTKDMVREWLDAYSDEVKSMGDKVSRKGILKHADEFADAYYNQAEVFYLNFFKLAKII